MLILLRKEWKDVVKQLGVFVVRSLNERVVKGKMSITQTEGIIICLPKGHKPREYLKDWRPISLLNVTYKIGSSCIANRLKTVLPNCIRDDQTKFVGGRYIGDNLLLLYNMLHYLKTKPIRTTSFHRLCKSFRFSWLVVHAQSIESIWFRRNICLWI